ncbi:hypothetical protein ACHAWT_007015 [Skeletonema menzelii]
MSKSKYPWHPANRPPPADLSLSANIALIGRVGKCLEAALDEIQKEDDAVPSTSADEGDGIDGASDGHSFEDGKIAAVDDTLSVDDQRYSAGTKRKRADSCDSSWEDLSKTHHRDADINVSDIIRMDKSLSTSIMEAYGKAVATTKFDPELHSDAPPNSRGNNNHAITAPAAMLTGEIDHYNRIGDRWRIVLKNASIKPRKATTITNGMTGHSLRRRLVMDWNDEGNGGKDSKSVVDEGTKKRGARQRDSGDDIETRAYRLKGSVQILAYDDDI